MKFLTHFREKQLLCTATYFLVVALTVGGAAAGARTADKAALQPLLNLQDGQRHLVRKGDPVQLFELIARTKSAWVASEARRSIADHYALTGSWVHYQKLANFASPCAKLLHAVYQQPSAVDAMLGPALATKPFERVCVAAFNVATAAGFLRDEDIWRQIRVWVNEGKSRSARALLRYLKEDKASVATLNKAVQNATKRIRGKHALGTRVSNELLAVSAVVAARRNPQLVGARWAKFEQYIVADINAQVWSLIGRWAALDHADKAALSYFRRVPLANQSRLSLAWRARAAMRLGDWQEVKMTIEEMRGEQATFSAWRYWHTHARYRLGDKQGAQRAWRKLANEFDDYYGLLASNHVGKQVTIGNARPLVQQVAQMAKDADVRLAVELGASGRTVAARKVWKFLRRTMAGPELLAAAEVAARGGWLLGSINAANEAAPQYSSHAQRFPLPLRDEILPLAKKLGVAPSFVYSLIRRESRFNVQARSSAGARGLMQIMPATAKLVARQHKYTRYHLSRLTLPRTNLLIGTRYVADLQKLLGDNPALVAAAYNAGPNRVRKWLKSSVGVNKLVFVETIPFTETRLYVKAILAAQEHYGYVLGQPLKLSLQERLAGRYS